MEHRDQAFFAVSFVLLVIVSVLGPWVQFHRLGWDLVATPLGLVYTLFFDRGSVVYLMAQSSSSNGSSGQFVFSIFASLVGLVYVLSKSGRFPEVEFI